MAVCYLGVGSNLGEREKNIEAAIRKVSALESTRLLKCSPLIQTHPEGGPKGQRDFLNASLKICTRLSPFKLLSSLKRIERDMGRVKTVRFGPRRIDLDILLYSDRIIKSKRLAVPHPRMFRRDFVLRSLAKVICA